MSKLLVGYVLCVATLIGALPQNDMIEVQQYLASLGIQDYNIEPAEKNTGNTYRVAEKTRTQSADDEFNKIYSSLKRTQNVQNHNTGSQDLSVQHYISALGIQDYNIIPAEKNTGNTYRIAEKTETQNTNIDLNNILKSLNGAQNGQFDNNKSGGEFKRVDDRFYQQITNPQQQQFHNIKSGGELKRLDERFYQQITNPQQQQFDNIKSGSEFKRVDNKFYQQITNSQQPGIETYEIVFQQSPAELTSMNAQISSGSSTSQKNPTNVPWVIYNPGSDDKTHDNKNPPHGPPQYGSPLSEPSTRKPPHLGLPPPQNDAYNNGPVNNSQSYEDRSSSGQEQTTKKEAISKYSKVDAKHDNGSSDSKAQSKNGIANFPLTLNVDSNDEYNDGHRGINYNFQVAPVVPQDL